MDETGKDHKSWLEDIKKITIKPGANLNEDHVLIDILHQLQAFTSTRFPELKLKQNYEERPIFTSQQYDKTHKWLPDKMQWIDCTWKLYIKLGKIAPHGSDFKIG
jgi:hypothetical protein